MTIMRMEVQLSDKFFNWASPAEKAVLQAFAEQIAYGGGETPEYVMLCIKNDFRHASLEARRMMVHDLAQHLAQDISPLDEKMDEALCRHSVTDIRNLARRGAPIDSGFLIACIANSSSGVAAWIVRNSKKLNVDLDYQDQYVWDNPHMENIARYLDIEDRLRWIEGPHLRNTALILAVKKGWDHVDNQYEPGEGGGPCQPMSVAIMALLESGARPDIQDACGNTALHIAFLHRNTQSIRALLEYGARMDKRNNAGLLPEDMLKVRYENINPFLYQQCGNDTNCYIHTLQNKTSWRRSISPIRELLAELRHNPAQIPSRAP